MPGDRKARIIPRMIKDRATDPAILELERRIKERLKAMGMSPNKASLLVGEKRDFLRDLFRRHHRPRAEPIVTLEALLEARKDYFLEPLRRSINPLVIDAEFVELGLGEKPLPELVASPHADEINPLYEKAKAITDSLVRIGAVRDDDDSRQKSTSVVFSELRAMAREQE